MDWTGLDRSPQAVHTALAKRFAGHRVIEVGTGPHGDGLMCFGQVASSASAVEFSSKLCRTLSARVAASGIASLSVQCADYRLADFGPYDFVTWWQQQPLTNENLLAHLRNLSAHGMLQPHALAVPCFELAYRPDRDSWGRLARCVCHREALRAVPRPELVVPLALFPASRAPLPSRRRCAQARDLARGDRLR